MTDPNPRFKEYGVAYHRVRNHNAIGRNGIRSNRYCIFYRYAYSGCVSDKTYFEGAYCSGAKYIPSKTYLLDAIQTRRYADAIIWLQIPYAAKEIEVTRVLPSSSKAYSIYQTWGLQSAILNSPYDTSKEDSQS
jgi:hypothetical protein